MSFDLYPDNVHRKDRLYETINDVNIYFNDAAQDIETIRQRTETITQELHDMYEKLSLTPPPSKQMDLSFMMDSTGQQVTTYIIKGLAGLVGAMSTQRAVSAQLERAAVNYLLREGRLGAAVFARVSGLPLWMRVGTTVGSGAVALIVVVAIELIIDSIEGAMIRDNLRRGINDEVPLRAKVYKVRKMNSYLKEDLLAFITSLGIMQKLGYNQQQLEMVQTLHIDEIVKRANEIYVNDSLIIDGLNELDSSRGSWRNEDPGVPLPISIIKDSLRDDECLLENHSLETQPNMKATMQGDGNFVVYDGDSAIWSSGTAGKGDGPHRLVLQSDGNLVVYDKNNTPFWNSGTNGKGSSPYQCVLKSNGSLVLWDKDLTVLWSTPATNIVRPSARVATVSSAISEDEIEHVKCASELFKEKPDRHVKTSRKLLQQMGYSLDQLAQAM